MLMTGYSMEQLLQDAIDHGALGVLDKPLNLERVLETVERAAPDGIVLLADDDEDFVESVSATLRDQGYSVLIARNGAEVIEMVQSNNIDVLVLDLKMPVLDGLQVYTQLKEMGRTLPTLIVTGYAATEAESLDTLTQMTNQGCLVKPFDPEALLVGIQELLLQGR
jgi:CheY-like chemotaxis protein